MQATHPVANLRSRAALVAAFSLLVNAGVAQQTATPTSGAPADSNQEEEVLVLSPFVVEASEAEGYRATETLAGSRIRTDLKDVAAPITVVTKEFLTDIGATDINDVLAYTAGTEGTRDFTASSISLSRPTDDIAANPFGANRVRGLEAPDITRDYFFTINDWIGFDTYNLDEVTINRGPNSVLAGLGTAAGIVNYSPQLANPTSNHTLLSFRYGSYGDLRGVLNSNLVLKQDVLAVRVAALAANRAYKQEPSFHKDRRIYLTSTYRPWKQTTIRASYEYANVKANNPNSLTPEDDISQWVALGSPVYDSSVTGTTVPAPLTAGGSGVVTIFDKSGALQGWANTSSMATYYQANLDPTAARLWSPVRMNSDRYLDLQNLNLNPSIDDREYQAVNFSVDQEILPKLFANASYVKEWVNTERLNLFRTEYASVFIDPNVRLADGSPNPHFGETYMQFRGLDNRGKSDNTNEAIRGTLTYDLDLRETNKWLGRYRLTGFVERRETETDDLQWNAKVLTDPVVYQDYSYRYYLGGSATEKATAVPRKPELVSNVPGFPPGVPVTASGATTIDGFYALKSDRKRLEKLDSAAFVVQAYLWDDKIVGMYGVRRDTDKAAEAIGQPIPGGNDVVTPAGAYPALTEFSDTTASYGVVLHPLPWLSLHYNRSENFKPNAGKIDLLGNPTPAPTGEGKDYGFTLNLFEGKLLAKFNWFELTAAGAPAEDVTFPLNQWTIPFLDLPLSAEPRAVMANIAASPAFQADHPGFVYESAIASGLGLVTGDQRLNGGYTSDQVSKGVELELTYNVTKNWRLMATVSKQEAKHSNIASNLTAFIEERLQYWQSTGLFDYPLVDTNTGWGQLLTGREYWERDSLPTYLRYKSAEGRASDQLAKWHGSLVTNYTFTDGPLNGFNVGLGARYIEGAVLGYAAITDDAGNVTALDLDNPFKNSSYIAADAWVGYHTKIFADKYDLSVQLNVRDLQESGHYRPISANSDGSHSAYRIMRPRTFYLTTTVEF